MDPNANLAELMELVEKFNEERDTMPDDQEPTDSQIDAWRMAELVEALDGWMSSGGFRPSDWKVSR